MSPESASHPPPRRRSAASKPALAQSRSAGSTASREHWMWRRRILSNAARLATSKVAAILGPGGAVAPRRAAIVVPPRVDDGQMAVTVAASIGDYRAGDEIWCETLQPERYGNALNRDVLVPRPAGRFLFGRLINRDDEKLQILPLEAGGRQQVVANPPWLAVASKLVRSL